MSRWSKRSKEEKLDILRKQREQKEPKEGYDAVDIYKNNEIPIVCPKCRCFSGSDTYEVVIKDFRPLGIKKVSIIKGMCRICKRPIERIFPPTFSDEITVFTMVFVNLKQKGRLKDLRYK